jgi:hypothetical protein
MMESEVMDQGDGSLEGRIAASLSDARAGRITRHDSMNRPGIGGGSNS